MYKANNANLNEAVCLNQPEVDMVVVFAVKNINKNKGGSNDKL